MFNDIEIAIILSLILLTVAVSVVALCARKKRKPEAFGTASPSASSTDFSESNNDTRLVSEINCGKTESNENFKSAKCIMSSMTEHQKSFELGSIRSNPGINYASIEKYPQGSAQSLPSKSFKLMSTIEPNKEKVGKTMKESPPMKICQTDRTSMSMGDSVMKIRNEISPIKDKTESNVSFVSWPKYDPSHRRTPENGIDTCFPVRKVKVPVSSRMIH